MRIAFLIATLGLVVRVCAGEAQDLSESDFKEARRLYVSKCSRCHKFYEPSAYTEADWHDWMEKMRKKSKLKPHQYDLVLQYTEKLRGKSGKTPVKEPQAAF